MNINRDRILAPGVVDTGQDTPPGSAFSGAWLVTFTDLISLLLTFFVLLFSMSSVNMDNWSYLSTTLSRSLRPSVVEEQPVFLASRFNISTIAERDATNLDYLASVFEELMSKDELLAKSLLTRLDDRLVIGLPGEEMFASMQAEVLDSAQQSIFALSSILRNVDNRIGVNGYSDSVISQGGGARNFTSNWELSIARAAAVGNYLRRSGVSQNITAYGFANTRYNQIAEDIENNHKGLADRVDIVIFPSASKQ